MSESVSTLCLGAGPSCLSFASEWPGGCILLEKESRPGGLCRSFHKEGGVFDLGGHSFHTPHQEVFQKVQELLGGQLYLQQRRATVAFRDRLIAYPFQQHFQELGLPEVEEACRRGMKEKVFQRKEPAHYEDFLLTRFGRGIADHFLLPYNRKLWGDDLSRISCDWTSQRVADLHRDPSGKSTMGEGGQRRPLEKDAQVGYPPAGGFEEIFLRMAERAGTILTGHEVVQIDPASRTVKCGNGRVFRYDRLIHSMPLPELLNLSDGVPETVHQAAAGLEWLSLHVGFLLVGRKLETRIQRIYCAEPEVHAHKICLNHNSSDSLRERECHAIMAEVSMACGRVVDAEDVSDSTVGLLGRLGIIAGPEDIKWKGCRKIEYGYPVYTHDRQERVRVVHDWLRSQGIHSLGRFGCWEYVNSDACIAQGMALAKQLREN